MVYGRSVQKKKMSDVSLDRIIELLKDEEEILKEDFGIQRIGVFGSYARGDQKEDSDVDILVELERPLGLAFIDLKGHLEELLGLNVDLVTIKALRPEFAQRILSEVVYT
jgi:uncharacterized protein